MIRSKLCFTFTNPKTSIASNVNSIKPSYCRLSDALSSQITILLKIKQKTLKPSKQTLPGHKEFHLALQANLSFAGAIHFLVNSYKYDLKNMMLNSRMLCINNHKIDRSCLMTNSLKSFQNLINTLVALYLNLMPY